MSISQFPRQRNAFEYSGYEGTSPAVEVLSQSLPINIKNSYLHWSWFKPCCPEAYCQGLLTAAVPPPGRSRAILTSCSHPCGIPSASKRADLCSQQDASDFPGSVLEDTELPLPSLWLLTLGGAAVMSWDCHGEARREEQRCVAHNCVSFARHTASRSVKWLLQPHPNPEMPRPHETLSQSCPGSCSYSCTPGTTRW